MLFFLSNCSQSPVSTILNPCDLALSIFSLVLLVSSILRFFPEYIILVVRLWNVPFLTKSIIRLLAIFEILSSVLLCLL